MRSFISAMVVAIALIGGAFGYSLYVEHTADELYSHTEEIKTAISNGNFAAAQENTQRLYQLLEDKKEVLGAIADHREIYDIQLALAELSCFIEDEEITECRAHCAAVMSMIKRLSGSSSPAIFNIL